MEEGDVKAFRRWESWYSSYSRVAAKAPLTILTNYEIALARDRVFCVGEFPHPPSPFPSKVALF